jgi:8-oxo-dGTP diphosphatase
MNSFPDLPLELPKVTVDVVIFTLLNDELKVLLVQRPIPPFEGSWTLPGGFVQPEESLEEAARRVLAEKGRITNVWLEQLYTFGEPHRDPRARIITVTYFALIRPDTLQQRYGDATVAWHPAYDSPPLGFDHSDIVRYAIQRLRYKLEYTAVAFQLLPEAFTLTELQNAYEYILREPLDKRNFRRKVLATDLLEETGDVRSGDHRPAKLYRFSENARFEIQARRLFP